MKNRAFTLAEVLITLGIVGVVAAMTIPNLVAAHKAHRLRSQFFKSYSVLQQVIKQMEADDISLVISDYSAADSERFYKTFKKYLKGSTDCLDLLFKKNTPAVCYKYLTGSTDKPYKTFDGKTEVGASWFDDGQILLPDGTLLLFENPKLRNTYLYISVDLNGYKNPPNRWGYDLFSFLLVDGVFKPVGDIGTNYTAQNKYCSLQSTDRFNGLSCAHRAINEPDYFKWVVKNVK